MMVIGRPGRNKDGSDGVGQNIEDRAPKDRHPAIRFRRVSGSRYRVAPVALIRIMAPMRTRTRAIRKVSSRPVSGFLGKGPLPGNRSRYGFLKFFFQFKPVPVGPGRTGRFYPALQGGLGFKEQIEQVAGRGQFSQQTGTTDTIGHHFPIFGFDPTLLTPLAGQFRGQRARPPRLRRSRGF